MVDSRKLIPESSWLNHFVIGGILLAGIQVGIKTHKTLASGTGQFSTISKKGLSIQAGRLGDSTPRSERIYSQNMAEDPIKETSKQEKKEFPTLFTLGIIYAIGTIVVIVAAVIFTSNIVN